MLVSLVGSFVIATKVQQLIARPILHLAEIAKEVTTEKNYSVRAVREGDDETGVLIGAFNQMLEQIEHRDAYFEDQVVRRTSELQESEERSRRLVETTNVIPWEADIKNWQFTYVGPQVVKLLGYPAEEWCREDFWTDHMHPLLSG